MKKFVMLLAAVMLVASMACPAFAAEDDFVPSITYKGAPELVLTVDVDGNPVVGAIVDEDGKTVGYVDEDCLLITALSGIDNESRLPAEAKAQLKDVYQKLLSGDMKLPYEGDKDMVILELVDASWLCEECPEAVEDEGVVFNATFDLGVAKDVEVTVMTYKNDAWNPIEKVVNNGDGTVTCTFEHLCPVAFAVATEDAPSETGDNSDMMLWGMLLALSAVGMATVSVLYFRNRKKA